MTPASTGRKDGAGLAAMLLALVHVFAGSLRFLEGVPRSRWLSFAGGISVAYVFARPLPELAEAQDRLGETRGGFFGGRDDHVYLLALTGLALFCGVERLTVESRDARREKEELPDRRRSRFPAFTVGAAGYAAILQVV